jgi:hypothetical protein
MGEPPGWAEEVDWGAVEEETDKQIPAAMAYSLTWDNPRPAEMAEKM